MNSVNVFAWLLNHLSSVIQNNYFNGFVVGCILLNTLSLALDGYPSNHFRDLIAEKLNLVLTFIFCFEMVLKLVGLTWREYREDRYNIFDGAVVAISLVELTLNLVDASSQSTGLSALRAFRLFRILKLARSWKSLRDLFRTVGTTRNMLWNDDCTDMYAVGTSRLPIVFLMWPTLGCCLCC